MISNDMTSYFAALKQIIKSALEKEDKTMYLEKLQTLIDKSKSDNINVAIVGEFNTGKSTFINALLRQRLLKEAGRPTTASATYISRAHSKSLFDILLGNKNRMSILFDDGHCFDLTEKDTIECSQYLKAQYGMESHCFEDIVHLATAEQRVATHVTDLRLSLKTTGIPQHVTIIDTPGFNPGDQSLKNHLKITEHVVADVADMAIILIPATQPLSRTLINFLDANIRRYIHRCVFIITKVDLLPESEVEIVFNYVKGQLEQLRIDSPRIYGISAVTVLPVKAIPDFMADKWPLFQNDFYQMETELWKELETYKKTTIYEHVYHLLCNLSEEVKNTLDAYNIQLSQTLRILEENTIERIEKLTNNAYHQSCVSLDYFYTGMNYASYPYAKTAKDCCYPIIRAGGKLKKYKTIEAPQINGIIQDLANQYATSVQLGINNSMKIVNDSIQQFRNEFHSHYKDMPSLEPNMDFLPHTTTSEMKAVDLTTSEFLGNEAINKAGRSVGLAAIGIGIGTLLFPGVGTVIGGALGMIVGWLGFGPTEQEIQDKVIAEVNDAIDSYFANTEQAMKNYAELIKKGQEEKLLSYCNKHIQLYGKRVEKLIKQQNAQKELMENNIHTTNNYKLQISQLQKDIRKEMQQLSLIK